VKKIERGGSRVKGVVTTKGEIYSEKAVIAAGAFSGRVGALASVEIPIKPYPRRSSSSLATSRKVFPLRFH